MQAAVNVAEGSVQHHTKSPKREFLTLEKSVNVRVRRFSLAAF
jgi:hypothetical protein